MDQTSTPTPNITLFWVATRPGAVTGHAPPARGSAGPSGLRLPTRHDGAAPRTSDQAGKGAGETAGRAPDEAGPRFADRAARCVVTGLRRTLNRGE